MGRIRQAFCGGILGRKGRSMEEALEIAASIGFTGIDLPGPFQLDELVKVAPKYGITPCMIGGHASLSDGMNNAANLERIVGEVTERIHFAADHGIPSLVCLSGNRRGLDDYVGLLNTAECLKRVAQLAEDKGVNLCMELLNSKVDHPDYQCDHTLWGVTMCRLVGSSRVKLLFDIYHMAIMEGDLIRNIRDYIGYIGHFHTAGNPGRKDLDDQQEIYYPAVMRAIADTGFDGFVGHEYSPKGDEVESLRAAFAACDV
jgi:hydroxypyruvate isomerase